MIPLSEAIEVGAWLRADCEAKNSGYLEEHMGAAIAFQVKPLKFTKVDLAVIDSPEKLSASSSANIWLLLFEVVNLCRQPLKTGIVMQRLVLRDEEGCQFAEFNDGLDGHLNWRSEFAKGSGLTEFYLGQDLPPKVRRRGALLYELPDFFEALFLDVRAPGAMREA